MQSAKRYFGEIVCGVVMFVLGIGLLFGARSALLYHTSIYMKGLLILGKPSSEGVSAPRSDFSWSFTASAKKENHERQLNVYSTPCI